MRFLSWSCRHHNDTIFSFLLILLFHFDLVISIYHDGIGVQKRRDALEAILGDVGDLFKIDWNEINKDFGTRLPASSSASDSNCSIPQPAYWSNPALEEFRKKVQGVGEARIYGNDKASITAPPKPLTTPPFKYYLPYDTKQACNIFGPTCQTGPATVNSSVYGCKSTSIILPCSSYLAAQSTYLGSFNPGDKLWLDWRRIFGRSPECQSYASVFTNHGTYSFSDCPAGSPVHTAANILPNEIPPGMFGQDFMRGDGNENGGKWKDKEVIYQQIGMVNEQMCCGNCTVKVPEVEVFYFPDPKANEHCESHNRRVGFVGTGDDLIELDDYVLPNRKALQNLQANGISTMIVSSHTLTSPSVYMQVKGTLRVEDQCGGIGSTLTSPFFSFRPDQVSTYQLKTQDKPNLYHSRSKVAEFASVIWDGMKNQVGTIDQLAQLTVADFECPSMGLGRASTDLRSLYPGDNILTFGYPYLPVIVPPLDLINEDPDWKSVCTSFQIHGMPNKIGMFDPPRVMIPQNQLAPAGVAAPAVTPPSGLTPDPAVPGQVVDQMPAPTFDPAPPANNAKIPENRMTPETNNAVKGSDNSEGGDPKPNFKKMPTINGLIQPVDRGPMVKQPPKDPSKPFAAQEQVPEDPVKEAAHQPSGSEKDKAPGNGGPADSNSKEHAESLVDSHEGVNNLPFQDPTPKQDFAPKKGSTPKQDSKPHQDSNPKQDPAPKQVQKPKQDPPPDSEPVPKPKPKSDPQAAANPKFPGGAGKQEPPDKGKGDAAAHASDGSSPEISGSDVHPSPKDTKANAHVVAGAAGAAGVEHPDSHPQDHQVTAEPMGDRPGKSNSPTNGEGETDRSEVSGSNSHIQGPKQAESFPGSIANVVKPDSDTSPGPASPGPKSNPPNAEQIDQYPGSIASPANLESNVSPGSPSLDAAHPKDSHEDPFPGSIIDAADSNPDTLPDASINGSNLPSTDQGNSSPGSVAELVAPEHSAHELANSNADTSPSNQTNNFPGSINPTTQNEDSIPPNNNNPSPNSPASDTTNPSTSSLTPNYPPITMSNLTFTPSPSGFSINNTPIHPSAPAVTINGTPISLTANGSLTIGSEKLNLAQPEQKFEIAGQAFVPKAEGFEVGNAAVVPGGTGVEVGGNKIRLEKGGRLEVGQGVWLLPLPKREGVETSMAVGVGGQETGRGTMTRTRGAGAKTTEGAISVQTTGVGAPDVPVAQPFDGAGSGGGDGDVEASNGASGMRVVIMTGCWRIVVVIVVAVMF